MTQDLVDRLGRRGWEAAQRQLISQGQQAVPFLAEALRDDEQDLRQTQAAQALGRMGPAAASAAPALIRALRSPQTHVRKAVAEALGKIGPPAEADVASVVANLRDLLPDRDPDVRTIATAALGRMGLAATAAVPDLVELLADHADEVREAAGDALVKIGEPAVPSLARALQARHRLRETKYGETRRSLWDVVEAVVAAGEEVPAIGPDTSLARNNLVWHLREAKDYLSVLEGCFFPSLATTLGRIGPPAAAAVAVLEEAAGDGNSLLRDAARHALQRIRPAEPR